MRPTRHDLTDCPNLCGERILWTRTEYGERMAVDAEPDPAGNQACMRDGLGRWVSRSLTSPGALAPAKVEHTYKPHFRKGGCAALADVQLTLPGLPAVARPSRRRRARR
ncbi:hypothetical protein [Herbidospora mongoliensis]|uniref:hypothetical protein n=1 Tax=Herbidospora mongoliensis TaxID=688067 RepID=UPI000B2C4DC0|nr:hypothetical protein [Herbidospora mongoliensis]